MIATFVAVAAAVGVFPANAGAADESSVVMFSDPGDYIGQGLDRLFDSANAQIGIGGSLGYVTVTVSGGNVGDSYWMDFAAPPGATLRKGGVYVNAQRAPFREAGRPGIDISGDGRGCNEDSGLFEVKDIGTDGAGNVDRLWLLYEQHCEGGTAALFGEVRIGEGTPVSSSTPRDMPRFVPTAVRWPAADAGRAGTVVPVTVFADYAPTTVSSVGIVGQNASSFTIRENDCTGQALAPGGSCEVWVRSVPTTAGTKLAALRVTTAQGTTSDAPLQAFAYGGETGVSMQSDAGDYIGQGVNWSYTPGNAVIAAGGTRHGVSFGINGSDGSWWSADFVPGSGDILAPGTYTGATRYPFNGTGPGMDVSGNGRGCNTLTGDFTVVNASWWPDGTVRGIKISFTQHCEGMTPALHGTVAFRAGDTTPLPPWMVSTIPPPPPPPVVPGMPPPPGGTKPQSQPSPRTLAGSSADALSRLSCSASVRPLRMHRFRGTRLLSPSASCGRQRISTLRSTRGARTAALGRVLRRATSR